MAKGGGLWDFTGCGFGQFWPSGFGFSLKNMRVFGFWILDGSRVLSFFELGFRVLQLKCAGFRVSDVTRVLNLTLDIENCRATVHTKQLNMSMLEYARSFGATMKESIKRLTHWAAYYHTSRKSWYPKPDGTIPFSKVAVIKPLPSVQMSPNDCEIMRGWASTYGAAVRQRTVRQETTMAKHGTLPEFIYQRQLDSVLKASLNFEEDDNSRSEGGEEQVMEGGRKETADEVDEFDESSDEKVEMEDEQEIVTGNQDEIGRATDILLGTRSRFGRAIRFNNRLLF